MKISQYTVDETMGVLRDVFTEDRTDRWIGSITNRVKLPWWFPKKLLEKGLDAMLPETLLKSIEELLQEAVE